MVAGAALLTTHYVRLPRKQDARFLPPAADTLFTHKPSAKAKLEQKKSVKYVLNFHVVCKCKQFLFYLTRKDVTLAAAYDGEQQPLQGAALDGQQVRHRPHVKVGGKVFRHLLEAAARAVECVRVPLA